MGAKTMGKFTKDEFIKGCVDVGAEDEKQWKHHLGTVRNCVTNYKDDYFHKVYMYAFEINQESGFKNIDIDVANAIWDLFYGKTCKFLGVWKQFLVSIKQEIVKRDVWDMFFMINRDTNGDMKNFEDDGTWASTIDEFVEFYHQKQ